MENRHPLFEVADANRRRMQIIEDAERQKHRVLIALIESNAQGAKRDALKHCRSEAIEISRDLKRIVSAGASGERSEVAETCFNLIKLHARLEELYAFHKVVLLQTCGEQGDEPLPSLHLSSAEAF